MVGAIVLTLMAIGWGVVYASASSLLEVYPVAGETVSTATPRLTATWLPVPGVRIKSLLLTIDGQKIELKPPKSGTGFAYRLEDDLDQGAHQVRLEVVYGMGAARKIDTSWSFTVDTEPPVLSLESGESFLVVPAPNTQATFITEGGARVRATLNQQPLEVATVTAEGRFQVDLTDLEKENTLSLTAGDAVGNYRSLTIPLILDETTPVISSLVPADGEVVRMAAPKVEVVFTEGDSGMRSMKLSIDGTEAVSKTNDGSEKLTYLGEMLADGPHTARVVGVDFAGREVVKEWSFSVDTRRIVINRSLRRLFFYQHGRLQRVFGVAVGMPRYPTPGGRWAVANKQVNPRWTNPGSEWAKDMPPVIAPGWSNPLGVRALALNVGNILIHGTSNYGSIGTAASHGCIRMRNSDIVNFFPQVGVGVPVDIL